MKKKITAMLLMGAMVISTAGTAEAAQTKNGNPEQCTGAVQWRRGTDAAVL